MFTVQLTPRAEKDLGRLPPNIQKHIRKKLESNAGLPDPLVRAKPLVDLPPNTHRFRIGKYRASFYLENNMIVVDCIEIRGSAYERH